MSARKHPGGKRHKCRIEFKDGKFYEFSAGGKKYAAARALVVIQEAGYKPEDVKSCSGFSLKPTIRDNSPRPKPVTAKPSTYGNCPVDGAPLESDNWCDECQCVRTPALGSVVEVQTVTCYARIGLGFSRRTCYGHGPKGGNCTSCGAEL